MCFSCIVGIIVNIIILNYVLNLEKDNCECSHDWKRDVIKVSCGILIVLSFVIIILNLANLKVYSSVLIALLYIVYIIVSIAHLCVTFMYYMDLNREDNCECSKHWMKHALIYPIIVLLVSVVIGVINMIIMWPQISKKMALNNTKGNRISNSKNGNNGNNSKNSKNK